MKTISESKAERYYLSGIWKKIEKSDLIRIAIVLFSIVGVSLGLTWPTGRYPVIAVVGLFIGCWPIIVEATTDIVKRKMSMEISMLLAIIAAAAIGEWLTSLLICVFVLAAEILEDLSMNKGEESITDLMSFLPNEVTLIEDGKTRRAPIETICVGQTILVQPGDKIAVDGVVRTGNTTLDQSRITGESMPIPVEAGSIVYAGSINQIGAIEVLVKKIGSDSSYGQIVAAVKSAQENEAPIERLADKLAAYLVYFALAAAALAYIVSRDVTATISVVVVAGACGVAAGTPLAILGAIASAARNGAFIKDGAYLEELSVADTVVLDKTGTITEGKPQLFEMLATEGYSEEHLIEFAASAEYYSEHPLGKAIRDYADNNSIPYHAPTNFVYYPGVGLRAEVLGKKVEITREDKNENIEVFIGILTLVKVIVNGNTVGRIGFSDQVRPEAAEAVHRMQKLGLKTKMLTGDSVQVAEAVGIEVGIDKVYAELLPEDKLRIIKELRESGDKVAMVGDGVNDAPALAVANIGIAMGSGTNIAQESSDIILVSANLLDLFSTIKIARRSRSIIIFNFIGTLLVDIIGIILAALGYLSPISAALIHVCSETAFILNSARLVPRMHSSTHTNENDRLSVKGNR